MADASGEPASGWRESKFQPQETASGAAFVRQMIEKVDTGVWRNFGLRLRADARLFLLTNLTEMIAKPILGGKQLETSELMSVMEGDLQLIARRAAERYKTECASRWAR